MSGAERRALNENVFREVNERLERLGEEFGDDAVEFLCECADPDCSAALSIPVSAYEAVRNHARRFLIVPGHQRADVTQVYAEKNHALAVRVAAEVG